MLARTVLISGAGRGLGAALATSFKARGDRVFRGMRSPDFQTPDVVELNVRSLDSTASAVRTVVDAAGSIDVLVNNAGIYLRGPLTSLAQDDFKETLDVNLLGVWRLTKATVPHMRPGSTIAMISSLSGLVGLPDEGAFAASKFALEGMCQSLAAEVAPLGLRVLVLEPGRMATGFVGEAGGDPVARIAEDTVERICAASTPHRSPLGEASQQVAEAIGLDTGTRSEAVVEQLTGRNWRWLG